jgi:ferric-dicitrate binding protein FerR (iron transport regulator)
MSPEPCSRVRDAASRQRLFGDATLLEHAKHCDVCAADLAAATKRREFRDAFPVLTSIADESGLAPSRAKTGDAGRRASRRRLLLMVAALIAMVGFFTRNGVFSSRSTPPEGDPNVATRPPHFRISNIANALFESKAEGGTVRSSITRGIAAFHVEPLGPGQRFFLSLPDGDIEVRGTRFVVSIDGAKTSSVDVSEGTVALRLRGRAEMLLSAGQRWPAETSGRPTLSFMRLAPRKDAGTPEPSKPNDEATR